MIGKTKTGKGFGGNLSYLLKEDKHAEILKMNGVYAENPKDLVHQFRAVSNGNEKVTNVVWHTSLSFYDSDKLTKDQMADVAEKFLHKAGFSKENNQYVIIQHNDTAHKHVHICANRVGFDGTCVSDSYCKSNTVKWSKELEDELKLTRVRDKRIEKVIARDKVPAFENAKQKVQQSIDSYLSQNGEKSFGAMSEALKKSGIDVNVCKHVKTGKEYGVSFKIGNLALKGSEIGKNYAFKALAAQIFPPLNIVKAVTKIISKGPDRGRGGFEM
jgi:hypothetical protein